MGALGPVFRTYEPTRDRLVAVKAFRLDITPEQGQALADELSHAAEAELFHPSIVEPIAAGVQGMIAYRAEEYVAAESLDVALRQYAPASFDTMIRIVGQLAEGIDVARRAGVGHGALHPRDIFVTHEDARASGFGVVDAIERVGLRAPVRRPYSAPERVAGAGWSTPADVFSLGAIAFELLTGRRPSGTGMEIGPLTGSVVQGAERLQGVLARAMHEKPEERFGTGLEFADALKDAALARAPVGAAIPVVRTAPPSERGGPRSIQMIPIPVEPPQFADEDEEATDEIPPPGLSMYVDEQPPAIPAAPVQDPPGWSAAEQEVGEAETESLVFEAADLALREPHAAIGDEFRFQADVSDPPLRSGPGTQPQDRFTFEQAQPEPAPAFVPPLPPPVFERPPTPPPQVVERNVPRQFAEDGDERMASYESGAPAERGRRSVLPLALMLIVGLALGFGAGYFFGPRSQQSQVADAFDTLSPPAASPEPAEAGEAAAVPTPAPGAANVPEPPPEAAAATTSKTARSGRLVVVTTPPGAAVTINGEPSGRAPLTKEGLSFGNYVVRVALPGYQPRNAQVRLSDGASSRTLSMQLQRESTAVASRAAVPETPRTQKPGPVPAAPMARPPEPSTAGTGTLEIDSRPVGAQAFVDGRPVGPTPVRVPDVAAGGRLVRFELAGHRTLTEIAQVSRGRTTRVARSLEPAQ